MSDSVRFSQTDLEEQKWRKGKERYCSEGTKADTKRPIERGEQGRATMGKTEHYLDRVGVALFTVTRVHIFGHHIVNL